MIEKYLVNDKLYMLDMNNRRKGIYGWPLIISNIYQIKSSSYKYFAKLKPNKYKGILWI